MNKTIKLITLFLTICLTACNSDTENKNSTGKQQASSEYKKVSYQNDYQIGQYTSNVRGFDTNSYWIEGPDGVVLIDTQLLPSATNQVVDIAESVTGKKVVLAIVLHPSPERFNGTATLQARGIRVVSSKQVVELITEADKAARHQFYQDYKPDYPDQLVLPEVAWDKTQEFDAAGLHFKAYVIRDGLNDAHLLIGIDKHLFVGGLVVNQYHALLQLGKSEQWLDRLEEIRKFVHPAVIHPGQGYAMNGEHLLSQQEDYLRFVRKAVADFYTGGKINEQDKKDIISQITQQYPEYGLTHFLESGVSAVWEKQRSKDHEMM